MKYLSANLFVIPRFTIIEFYRRIVSLDRKKQISILIHVHLEMQILGSNEGIVRFRRKIGSG